MTLVFPDSLSNTSPRTAPLPQEVLVSDNGSVQSIPSTGNALYPISKDTALAFSVPYDEASNFLATIQQLPNKQSANTDAEDETVLMPESKYWIMTAAKNNGSPGHTTLRDSAGSAWTGFVDLIKVRLPVTDGACKFLTVYRMRRHLTSL